MKTLIIYFFLFTALCISSCSDPEGTDEKKKLISLIDSLHKKMLNPQSMELDKNRAQQGIAAYEDFIKKYPDDSLAAEYLFRVSDLFRGRGDNAKALESLKQICKKYPDHKKIPDCIFLQGYYMQELFGDTAAAKQYYQKLLSKYPHHPFADDAKALMNMFGKTDEQILKEFEKNAESQKK